MRPAGPATAGADGAREGIVPTLAELVALRAQVQRVPQPRQGRLGVHGPAPSKLRGRGMEYAESRQYTIGDDVRRMDWRLTARSGRAHTKLFQAERERLTLLVADTAPELYFGTRVRFKSVQAARAGAVAVWSALQSGDRIAALRGGEAAIPPASGLRGAMRVLDALVRWYTQPPADHAPLEEALEHAQRLLRPDRAQQVLRSVFAKAHHPVHRTQAGKDSHTPVHSIDRTSRTFQATDRSIIVDRQNQAIALSARLLQIADMPGMQNVEAAIGEDDFLAMGASILQRQ